jgi:hypothetical protein
MTTTALSLGCARAARYIPWLHALAQHANIQSKSDHRELITCNHFLFRAASSLVWVTVKCSSVCASAAKRCRRGAGTRRSVEARLHFFLSTQTFPVPTLSQQACPASPSSPRRRRTGLCRCFLLLHHPRHRCHDQYHELKALHLRSRTACAAATLCHPLSQHSARAEQAALRRRAISAIASVTVLERLEIIGLFGL